MKILVDTNVLIALEPVGSDLEPLAPIAAEFLGLAASSGHQVVRHAAQDIDRANDRNEARRSARDVLIAKYPVLPKVRSMPPELEVELGSYLVGSNDWVDNQLIGALEAKAVDFLVTEDAGIHRKGRRVGLGDRIFRVADVRDMLRTFLDEPPPALPAVRWMRATEIQERDPIFDSVRADYDDFDVWLAKCRVEEREVAIIEDASGGYAAVCIVARKNDKFATQGKFLKVCQFKVDDRYRGRRYGELLLKAIFEYRRTNGHDFAYVTAFERHDGLIRLFEDFGFLQWVDRTTRGELILIKRFRASETDRLMSTPLDFHVRFGPPALSLDPSQTYVVPIQPEFHRLLFPEAERQFSSDQLSLGLRLDDSDRPFGNSLRKAYLCHAQVRALAPGATLLFYRSHDLKALTCVGVVERSSRETDVDEIARIVGKRTVYSYQQIEALAAKPVLTILFRQDRILEVPIPLADLLHGQLLSSHPQSITTIKQEGFAWMMGLIGA
jgi:GNAT superfamily N-acetyltransferase